MGLRFTKLWKITYLIIIIIKIVISLNSEGYVKSKDRNSNFNVIQNRFTNYDLE
jgi:hypothetical protein